MIKMHKLVLAKDIDPVDKEDGFYFETIDGNEWLTIQWGGYDYDIELSRICSPREMCSWLHHICGKNWPIKPWQLSELLEQVFSRKGWSLFAPEVK